VKAQIVSSARRGQSRLGFQGLRNWPKQFFSSLVIFECKDTGVLDSKSGPGVIDSDNFDVPFALRQPIRSDGDASLGERI